MRVRLDPITGESVPFPVSPNEARADAPLVTHTEYEASRQRYRDAVKKAATPYEIDFAKKRLEYEFNMPVPYPFRSWTAFREHQASVGATSWQSAMYTERQNPPAQPEPHPQPQVSASHTRLSMRQCEAATDREIAEAIGTDDEDDVYEADDDDDDVDVMEIDSPPKVKSRAPPGSRSLTSQTPRGIRKQSATPSRSATSSRNVTPSRNTNTTTPARRRLTGHTRSGPPTSPPSNATYAAGTRPIPAQVLQAVNEIKAISKHKGYPSIKPLGKILPLDGRYGYIERHSDLMGFYGDTRLFTEKWWKFLSVGGSARQDLVAQMGLGDAQP
ncbi:hypothetical protein CERZMDRAFT_106253 [Cercospora zeae-maydis SCOH1-5]|uniref:Uncharacterized protein n=1 Tax=Cercospora zeae-maydis SCOH1-5 TaxID=717836 RepID=A0A6A6FF30_9PEZI|nr:hypothetical protein CERZMDRAFT_106253 [Cercospora zeae-maydis SCOH1-5]